MSMASTSVRDNVAEILARYQAVKSVFDEIPAVGADTSAVDAAIYEMRACELHLEALRRSESLFGPVQEAQASTVPILCRLHAVYTRIRAGGGR